MNLKIIALATFIASPSLAQDDANLWPNYPEDILCDIDALLGGNSGAKIIFEGEEFKLMGSHVILPMSPTDIPEFNDDLRVAIHQTANDIKNLYNEGVNKDDYSYLSSNLQTLNNLLDYTTLLGNAVEEITMPSQGDSYGPICGNFVLS